MNNIESLEKICQTKGVEIFKVLLNEYDSIDFETRSRDIEKEIYEVALCYSKILFFETKLSLQESLRSEAKTHLSSRFDGKQVKKMSDIDLIAYWIKSEVIRNLENKGIFL